LPQDEQLDLPTLSFAETFELVNPETEWGVLVGISNLSPTKDMFDERGCV
jgi:hypothetical protein